MLEDTDATPVTAFEAPVFDHPLTALMGLAPTCEATGMGPVGHGRPVVAGPPDDALEHARMEIAAALGGFATPGAMF